MATLQRQIGQPPVNDRRAAEVTLRRKTTGYEKSAQPHGCEDEDETSYELPEFED